MNNAEIQQERRVAWSNEDLVLFALIIKLMEMDPTFENLERVFRKGAKLMHRLRMKPQREKNLTTEITEDTEK